ncbi:MAG: hypothetical protein AMS27_11905 [Bacteroides sp. SM23_62_1]|nr:MAG: hypothetical protein AMS27_11905 [Bacteroides sp. SM23_62_1]
MEQGESAPGNITFWIILFFLIRLIGVTNPPLETEHNWRQCFTNMIARNFLDISPNILYPRIDYTGNEPDIVGAEFPLFNYFIFLAAKVFGYQHWYGRLINLIISSIGVYFFSLLVHKLFDQKIAFAASIILLCSLWFSYSRKIMPDTFSISLMFISLYFCFRYIEKGTLTSLILFLFFGSFGTLSKIPAISYLSLLIIPIFSKQPSEKIKLRLIATGIIIFLVTALWYFYWVPYLVNSYHNQLFWPKSLSQGLRDLIQYWPDTLEKFYFASLHSYIAFICFLAGIYLVIKNRYKLLGNFLGVFTFVFFLFMLKFGQPFSHHSYYIIPFTPLMALAAGYAVSRLSYKFQLILLIAIALEGILNQQHDFFVKKSELYKVDLEQIADSVCRPGDLIIINGGDNPQQLYFTHRKGWTVNNEALLYKDEIHELCKKGARYLFVNKTNFQENLEYQLIYENNYFDIYKLTDP